MLDADYKPHILELNLAPQVRFSCCCHYSAEHLISARS